MSNFIVRTQAKYQTLCLRCFRTIKKGAAIVQEENGKWSHAVCPGYRKPQRTDAERNVREEEIKI